MSEKVGYDQRVETEFSVVVGKIAYCCKLFLNTHCCSGKFTSTSKKGTNGKLVSTLSLITDAQPY